MTGDEDQARLVAKRIAHRVSASPALNRSPRIQSGGEIGAELSAMRASLDSLRQKLVQLESRLIRDEPNTVGYSERVATQPGLTWATIGSAKSNIKASHLGAAYESPSHPSQERFGIEEATVSELVDFLEGEKKCDLEPGGQPCDHCAACSSRGF
jgi:hypothetical protein